MATQSSSISFKKRNSFDKRIAESKKVIEKYPDKIPVIVEPNYSKNSLPLLDKEKFLVPRELTVSQLIFIIRQRMRSEKEKALFLFVKDTLPTSQTFMSELYASHGDPDGFLYCTVIGESTFGVSNDVLILDPLFSRS